MIAASFLLGINLSKSSLYELEMRMLLYMRGKTRQNIIRNDNIRECWGNTYSNISRKIGEK